jgi:HAD superfamily hydrolase (TIGR01457 family)
VRYRGYLFDLDGTLYRGDEVIPGAVEKVRELAEAGAIVRYVTNNSTQTPEFFAQKLTRMGFPCTPEQVISSAVGTARYLVEHGVPNAFVVGESGLVSILEEHGVRVTTDEHPAAVVVGLCRTFTYDLMNEAMRRIRAGALFVATNPDATFPQAGGVLTPGAGSVVAAIRACSETEPVVIGKPKPYLIQASMEDAGLRPEETLVIGDRVDTDIESGTACGCPTFLVLTGVAHELPPGQAGGADLSTLP